MPDEDSVANVGVEQYDTVEYPSLIIPVKSGTDSSLFIEIFPEELGDIPSSQLLQVLKDESADDDKWADVGLAYMQQGLAGESSAILQAACDRPGVNSPRLFATAGIALLAAVDPAAEQTEREDVRQSADQRFTTASKLDTFFPVTWVGNALRNYDAGRYDQARFYFDTTNRHKHGQVLPALLGMAAVLFRDGDYKGAQELYAKAIRLYPAEGGAAVRVGFGLASYKLGQVDRAKAAFRRALELDPEFVPAMVGSSILDMASLDPMQSNYRVKAERAIKIMSTANLLDHNNAMIQNHLANHYFWKWTPIPGSVTIENGSKVFKVTQPIPLDAGDKIRIGLRFETVVQDDSADNLTYQIRDAWTEESGSDLKAWRKDYDRVTLLAKGAYKSTDVKEIRAESLFILGRVHHAREDNDHAKNFYDNACKQAPDLSPARFGLAQTLLASNNHKAAAAHLKLVLGMSTMATDAVALLGLLEVKLGKMKEGLLNIRKAIDLDPLNPDLIVLEAVALQQEKTSFPKSLERYKKAIELMEKQDKDIPSEILCNVGVLCHETKAYDEALEYYVRALNTLDPQAGEARLENKGMKGGEIRNSLNSMFADFVETGFECIPSSGSETVKLQGTALPSCKFVDGDHVRFGDDFVSEIKQITESDGAISIELTEPFQRESEDDMEQDSPMKVSVKRENRRLDNSNAITIAFNIARVHENAGKPIAAVELHKAIISREPAYANSYLRLACIARDTGSLKECSSWLQLACKVNPGNPEVLTLVGNLHLSLCDWGPAQSVFDQLLSVPSVDAYAKLSIGNIYFANLDHPKTYAKHLKKAIDLYKSILGKDKSNAYAANGIGTVLAEKGQLFKAKEVFNRVREVSGDSIADALLNLGHIYLAQKKHPEALQMYQSYMKRTRDGTTPITTKNREDDEAEVLLYIAFAYFDWARLAEAYNNAQSAPADERYKKCIENLELALEKSKRKEVILQYNLCMTKLQAANCQLQKLTRNIRRTAKDVEDALAGLKASLPKVQEMLKWKEEGKKINIQSSMLKDFITHCQANIESAESHLEEEKRREREAEETRKLQRDAAEAQKQAGLLKKIVEEEQAAKEQEERDRKAAAKMQAVEKLQADWEQEAKTSKKPEKEKKDKGGPPPVEDDAPADETSALFEDSSEDEDETAGAADKDEDTPDKDNENGNEASKPEASEKDLFGDSSDEESDEELIPTEKKRAADESETGSQSTPAKRQKILEDEDED